MCNMPRFEQKDPLLIYKFESYQLFSSMLSKLNVEIASFLMKAQLPTRTESVRRAQAPQRPDDAKLQLPRRR